MLDGSDDLSADDASPPSKAGEELRPTASSSDAAEEAKTYHEQGDVRSRRRRGSSRGPRDRLSQSSHDGRGDRLSQSSHNKSSRRSSHHRSQSRRSIIIPTKDGDTLEQAASPTKENPDHLDEAALLHELRSQSVQAIPEAPLDLPSVLTSSGLAAEEAKPDHQQGDVKSRRRRESSRGPRDRLNFSDKLSQSSHNKPSRRSGHYISQSTRSFFTPTEDGDTQEQAATLFTDNPDHLHEAVLLHEQRSHSVTANLEAPLDLPSVTSSDHAAEEAKPATEEAKEDHQPGDVRSRRRTSTRRQSETVNLSLSADELDNSSWSTLVKSNAAKRGENKESLSPGGRPKIPSFRDRRLVSSVAASKLRDTSLMLDGSDDLSADDASPPSKAGEELRPVASSSDAAEEAKTYHEQGDFRSRRRRGSSRGPRDKLSQSSHCGRSTDGRGDKLSQSSHDKSSNSSRRNGHHLSHSRRSIIIPLKDGDTQEQAATPSKENPDYLDEVAPLHELRSQLVPANLEGPLDPPSVLTPSSLAVEETKPDHQPRQVRSQRRGSTGSTCDILSQSIQFGCSTDAPLLLEPQSVTSSDLTAEEAKEYHQLGEVRSRRRGSTGGPRDRLSQSSVIASGLPLEAHSEHTKHTSSLEALLSRPVGTFILDAPSLDPPSICLSPISHMRPVQQIKPGKWKTKLSNLLNKPKPVTTFTLLDMDAPSVASPAAATIIEENAPSLDPPSTCLSPIPQIKPGKWKNKLADLLSSPKPVSNLDAPSLAPPSVCDIPVPSETESQKALSKKPVTTSTLDAPSLADPTSVCFLADLLSSPKPVTNFTLDMGARSLAPPSVCDIPLPSEIESQKTLSKKPMTTSVLDAPSLPDSPSACIHANPNAQENRKSQGVKDGSISEAHAGFSACVDLSKQSDPRVIALGELAVAPLAAKSPSTGNKNAAATMVEEATSLDSPPVCLHPVSQTKTVPQMEPGKEKNKLADDLLNNPNPVAPSLAPPSACAIPLPSESDSQKTQAQSEILTGLGEPVFSMKLVTTLFNMDAPSTADLSKQSKPRAVTWRELAMSALAAEVQEG
jgi:hypothetical protein